MGFLSQDHGDAFDRAPKADDPGGFADLWPSDSKGSGLVVQNNRRTGKAQGKGSFLRKAPCQECGFLNDLNKIDSSGGSLDGDGAGGGVSKSTQSTTMTRTGTSYTEPTGNQAHRKGAGCALCFSKNSSAEQYEIVENMNPIPPLGF